MNTWLQSPVTSQMSAKLSYNLFAETLPLSLLRNSWCSCTCNFQTHVYRWYERENWPWWCLLQAQVCSIGVDSKSLKSAWIYKATLIFLWAEKNSEQCCYKKNPLSVPDTSRPELIRVAKRWLNSNHLWCRRPLLFIDLQSEFKAFTMQIIPVLHTSI